MAQHDVANVVSDGQSLYPDRWKDTNVVNKSTGRGGGSGSDIAAVVAVAAAAAAAAADGGGSGR